MALIRSREYIDISNKAAVISGLTENWKHWQWVGYRDLINHYKTNCSLYKLLWVSSDLSNIGFIDFGAIIKDVISRIEMVEGDTNPVIDAFLSITGTYFNPTYNKPLPDIVREFIDEYDRDKILQSCVLLISADVIPFYEDKNVLIQKIITLVGPISNFNSFYALSPGVFEPFFMYGYLKSYNDFWRVTNNRVINPFSVFYEGTKEEILEFCHKPMKSFPVGLVTYVTRGFTISYSYFEGTNSAGIIWVYLVACGLFTPEDIMASIKKGAETNYGLYDCNMFDIISDAKRKGMYPDLKIRFLPENVSLDVAEFNISVGELECQISIRRLSKLDILTYITDWDNITEELVKEFAISKTVDCVCAVDPGIKKILGDRPYYSRINNESTVIIYPFNIQHHEYIKGIPVTLQCPDHLKFVKTLQYRHEMSRMLTNCINFLLCAKRVGMLPELVSIIMSYRWFII